MKNNRKIKSALGTTKSMPVSREFLQSFRKRLVIYMEANPKTELSKSELVRAIPNFPRLVLIPALTFSFLTLVFSITSIASKNSVPGDLLYPVKILSEHINTATSFTPEAKIKTFLSNAENRVNEASVLIKKSFVPPNNNSEQFHANMQRVITNFNTQVSGTLSEQRHLKEKNDIEKAQNAARDIQSATDSYRDILSNVKNKVNDTAKEEVNKFIDSNDNFHTRAESEINIQNQNNEKTASLNESLLKPETRDNEGKQKNETINQTTNPIVPSANSIPNVTVPKSDAIDLGEKNKTENNSGGSNDSKKENKDSQNKKDGEGH